MDVSLPDIETLIELRNRNHERFESVIRTVEYDHYGMWYSELFLFALICEHLNCNRILESGRARGFSTDVLSHYFEDRDVKIISVDDRPGSEDAQIAERKLADSDNAVLVYGDSTDIVPELVDERTAVLIDGPKGDTAVRMGIDVLEQSTVPLVGLHDLNRDKFYRDLSELLFTYRLYTDDEELVSAFRQYDEPIHAWNRDTHPEENMWGPYLKRGEESYSYGPTLGMFFGGEDAVDARVWENYRRYTVHDTADLVEELLRAQCDAGGPVRSTIAGLALKFGSRSWIE